ncbi:guanylate kinase 1, isoform CRA_b [Jimgerdemannia flammicorona]|uniref:Guanylate kinase 1, isoform CRA_b n=1 Tax=Jimgerdemannia flammicorona TaxID=994334 RepID=A0A433D2M2_9FUNG|nr:guanylate kinase 1, isoform CRA_b [Jimgerdemannia flammicorona]
MFIFDVFMFSGTSMKAVQDVLDSGKICMLDIDMQGVQQVKKTTLNPRYIFIRPPSPELETLEGRIRGRQSGEREEAIQARLAAAVRELEYASLPNSYDFVIMNDNLDRAYSELKVAVLE